VKAKKIEVHIYNILDREQFRRTTVTSESCDACVTGMGADGYFVAAEYLTWRK
ncbi:MAG: type II 3-dehydroquinate dehydratase, partial [Clostridiales bacterium]|nr:type II 3-dehydroquinate dehydratase [Clostridiales bacterium]